MFFSYEWVYRIVYGFLLYVVMYIFLIDINKVVFMYYNEYF